MCRHTQSQNAVLKAEVSEFRCLMTAMAVKYQQPLLALIMLRIFVKVLDPFEAQFVVSPSIIANSDSLGCWNASVVPGR
jgi:hypothetical protein